MGRLHCVGYIVFSLCLWHTSQAWLYSNSRGKRSSGTLTHTSSSLWSRDSCYCVPVSLPLYFFLFFHFLIQVQWNLALKTSALKDHPAIWDHFCRTLRSHLLWFHLPFILPAPFKTTHVHFGEPWRGLKWQVSPYWLYAWHLISHLAISECSL